MALTAHAEPELPAATDSVVAIQKHAARLVQLGLLTKGGASSVQQALERALVESTEDRRAVVALVDGLLHALAHGLLQPELVVVDPAGSVATFHVAPVLAVLGAAGLLTTPTLVRLKPLLRQAEDWFPGAGLSGFQARFTFGPGDRRRSLALDLPKAREFLKRTEAVPSR
jgi:hypothetical protein